MKDVSQLEWVQRRAIQMACEERMRKTALCRLLGIPSRSFTITMRKSSRRWSQVFHHYVCHVKTMGIIESITVLPWGQVSISVSCIERSCSLQVFSWKKGKRIKTLQDTLIPLLLNTFEDKWKLWCCQETTKFSRLRRFLTLERKNLGTVEEIQLT